MSKQNSIIELSQARRCIKKALLVILSVGIPYFFFVLLTGIRIPCVFFEITGCLCSGCGVTRMFMSMAHLRFKEAFAYNPFTFVLFFISLLWTILAFVGKPEILRSKRVLKFFGVFIAILAIIFAFLRNIC